MNRHLDIVDKLKLDILELKKELAATKEENQLHKVKIRKLQNELSKRDKQIGALLDPRKSSLLKKSISDKGASMFMSLREQNQELEKTLYEKEALIKRLQSGLETSKLYNANFKQDKKKKQFITDKTDCSIPFYSSANGSNSEKDEEATLFTRNLKAVSLQDVSDTKRSCFQSIHTQRLSMFRARSVERSSHLDKLTNNVQRIKQASNLKARYEGLSRQQLLSIIENLKANQQNSRQHSAQSSRKGGSPESDLERTELQCDTPQQEMRQLQNYFLDVLSEVDCLKLTIESLRTEHQKTVEVVKERDGNIIKLADEIEKLKQVKPVKKPLSSGSAGKATHKRGERKKSLNEDSSAETTCSFTGVEELKHTDASDYEQEEELAISQTARNRRLERTENREDKPREVVKNEEELRREKFNCIMQQMRAAEACDELKMFFHQEPS